MEAINVEQLTEQALGEMNCGLADKMQGDCVLIHSALQPPIDDEFRIVVENLREQEASAEQTSRNHLAVVLETDGGFMETVERLVAVMREHYENVSFIVPNYAFSAGTVLALSGDDIYMDYFSVLGPIDPQYRSADGAFLPGYGLTSKFSELCDKINNANSGASVRAELALLVKSFDPAQIFQIEQAVQHGVALITEWLPKYKFKNWSRTKSKNKKVTPSMKRRRAESIAATLGDASKWHSHGRGISMRQLASDELKLKINDFGADHELSSLIRNYHGLTIDFFAKTGMQDFIHSKLGARRVA